MLKNDSGEEPPNIKIWSAPEDPPPLPAFGSQYVTRWYKSAISLNTSTQADFSLSSFGSTNPLLAGGRCYLEKVRVYILPGKNTADSSDYRGILATLVSSAVSTNGYNAVGEDIAPQSRLPGLEFTIPREVQETILSSTSTFLQVTTPQGFPTSTAGSNPVVYAQAKFRISV